MSRMQNISLKEVVVEGNNVGRIYIHSGGRIKDCMFGKPDGVAHYYKDRGGLSSACLFDDDPDNTSAWIERGGACVADLSQVAGEEKFTEIYIEQAAIWLDALMLPAPSLDDRGAV